MDVKLSDDNMKDIIAKAVIDTLTPESRDELIKTAIKELLTVPNGTGYGQRKSPLQEAFDAAVRQVAREVAREQIVGNELMASEIKGMVTEAWAKLTTDEHRTKTVERLVDALEKGLTGDRY
jgi:hypothetical protein